MSVRLGEFAAEAGWLVVIVLLLPVLIPLGVLAVIFVLQERLAGESRRRVRGGGIAE
jgi:hypothetical protein